MIEATDLNAVLPVDVSHYEDVEFGPHEPDDGQFTKHQIMDIARVGNVEPSSAGISPESLNLLQHYGLPGFNRVLARPGAQVYASTAGQPLLITGNYGTGKTAVFTGFTPAADEYTALPLDEYMLKNPSFRAYFAIFGDLLADVIPGASAHPTWLLALHEKPLFQTLKEQPETKLIVTKLNPVAVDGVVARCRVQIEATDYAHLVHLKIDWQGERPKPFLTEFSNGDFELLPGESKEIEVEWRTTDPNQPATGILVVAAANAPETRLALDSH
jgi:hypothetical protein